MLIRNRYLKFTPAYLNPLVPFPLDNSVKDHGVEQYGTSGQNSLTEIGVLKGFQGQIIQPRIPGPFFKRDESATSVLTWHSHFEVVASVCGFLGIVDLLISSSLS